jgi:hypothetical protein
VGEGERLKAGHSLPRGLQEPAPGVPPRPIPGSGSEAEVSPTSPSATVAPDGGQSGSGLASTSVASLSLAQLLDEVGRRVRQEMQAQTARQATLYRHRMLVSAELGHISTVGGGIYNLV